MDSASLSQSRSVQLPEGDLLSIGLCQVRDLHPKEETDIRPTLVSVGLLLAPDEFQMVLDADNIPESNDFSWQHFNCILAQYDYISDLYFILCGSQILRLFYGHNLCG